jgi:hypothetical protein
MATAPAVRPPCHSSPSTPTTGLTSLVCPAYLETSLLPILPDVLQSSKLCSVRGRSILDGGLAILSAIQYLEQKKQPGFLVSLDLFHAYDRVDLLWVDKVMEAMGFGHNF